jgi:predicted CXXCH cytochrome family protein
MYFMYYVRKRFVILFVLLLVGIGLILAAPARAEKVDCLMCHGDLAQGKVIHAAVQMGCEGCHTGVDASNIPHKFKGRKGLSAEPPDLCYNCHAKDEFTRKVQHPPVMAGMCTSCHSPHSGPNPSLLKNKGNAVCLECHAEVPKKPHAVTSWNPEGHPLEGESDMKREDKPLECISCHHPHSSEWPKLFRYPAKNARTLCKNCHEFLQ